jgi:pre-mRNA-splicing factor 18
MGVTMVGIHERAGREKIFSQHTARMCAVPCCCPLSSFPHSTAVCVLRCPTDVLNDENQRKYIQAMKRLMTYCQHKFPTVPSKMCAV